MSLCDSAYTAAEGVDALILATGWPEFRSLDFVALKTCAPPLDCGHQEPTHCDRLRGLGFEYMGIGRMSAQVNGTEPWLRKERLSLESNCSMHSPDIYFPQGPQGRTRGRRDASAIINLGSWWV